MSMSEWAKREVELAKKRERGDAPEDEWDYGCACYDSALKAYNSLMEDGHSGMDISITKQILIRLIEWKCLTPIEDTENIWNEVSNGEFQCKRMFSLFKTVYPDGTVEYHDNNRVIGIDLNSDLCFHGGVVSRYVDEKYPITMPYIPGDRPYKVYTEDFCYKKPDAVGEYTHKALLYMIRPDGVQEEINKFYAVTASGDMEEISQEQYYADKKETFGE